MVHILFVIFLFLKNLFIFILAQSNYSLRPRKHVDYALLHQGKELQFPTYGFSPAPGADGGIGENAAGIEKPSPEER